MHRVELKDAARASCKLSYHAFLMHRVELKETVNFTKCQIEFNRVPNAPCGVESLDFFVVACCYFCS